jgi:hypothetical protein
MTGTTGSRVRSVGKHETVRPSRTTGVTVSKGRASAVPGPDMIWVGWSNGTPSSSGAGYGLRVAPADRGTYFRRSWPTVTLVLMGGGPFKLVPVSLSDAFWRSCPELRDRKIGAWFRKQRVAPWPLGEPPRFSVTVAGRGKFLVSKHAR